LPPPQAASSATASIDPANDRQRLQRVAISTDGAGARDVGGADAADRTSVNSNMPGTIPRAAATARPTFHVHRGLV